MILIYDTLTFGYKGVMRTLLACLIAAAGLAGCATDVAVGSNEHDVVDDPYVPSTESAYAPLCEGDGELDFALSATGLSQHEGQLVWMSAVEPELTPHASEDAVVVFQEGRIEDGAFALSCEDSLSENFAYPSFTVVIDADGSGDCSADDIAGTFQGYGWADDQVFVVTVGHPSWVPVEWTTVAEHWEVWGEEFCSYYFDDVTVDGSPQP